MPDAKQSGYKAAAQPVVFSGTRTLVSLAAGEYTDASDAIDNSTNLYLLADWELVVDFDTTAPTDGGTFALYLIPSVDDTNYADWVGDGTVNEPTNEVNYVGSFTVSDILTSQRLVLMDVVMPPGKFKVGIRNNTSQPLTSGAHTLKWRPKQYASG